MALPVDGRTIGNIYATTFDAKIPEIIDGFFNSNSLFVRLNSRGKLTYDGGNEIRSTFMYTGVGGGSYTRGVAFDTSFKEFLTDLILQWKQNYVPINMDGLDRAKNQGVSKIIDYMDALAEAAGMTIADNIGTQLFQDAGTTLGASTDIDGLLEAISATNTYGGINRGGGDAIATACQSYINSVGGAFNLPMLNTAWGSLVFGNKKVDLIVTTQPTWNKIWERTQPMQRFNDSTSADLAKLGFKSFDFNGADVVVDSHCPTGVIYLLNTEFMEYWVCKGKDIQRRSAEFGFTKDSGGFPVFNMDATVDQLITYSNLVVKGPRYSGRISSVS